MQVISSALLSLEMLYIYINSNYKAAIDTQATLNSTLTFSHFVSGSVFYNVGSMSALVLQQASIISEVRMIRKSSSILTVSR